ncbi:MAG: penicillin-binding transpeptidase domain-containing protein [Oscillospiraceae bacterium]|nr:penicillin-binding transpeptidase domain-containing protein [Oscillospiraceae bacterium]
MNPKKVLLHRILIMGLLCAVVFGGFALRLVELQVVKGETYLEQASTTSSVYRTIRAARGEIVDRYGRVLATNRTGFNLQLNKVLLPDEQLNVTIISVIEILQAAGEEWHDDTPLSDNAPYQFVSEADGSESKAVSTLKDKFGKNVYATAENVWDAMVERYQLQALPEDMQRIVGGIRYQMELKEYSARNPYTLASDVSIKTVTTIKEQSLILPGVDIIEEPIRYYPDGTLMPHIIGTVGPIYAEEAKAYKEAGYDMNAIVGKTGIELAYEDTLCGTDGVMEIVRNKQGAIIETNVIKEPVPGNTVVLTVDKYMQEQAQISLANLAATVEGSEGAATVVLDTKTGGVLAIATYPSFDLNQYISNYNIYAQDPLNPLFNRAVSGTYRPGSAFKPIVGLTGLVEGAITPTAGIVCSNPFHRFPDQNFRCLQHGHANGQAINIVQALTDSCNTFFYETGVRVGNQAYNQMANNMGLGVKTGFELKEATGNLTSQEFTESLGGTWNPGNVAQAAIGQMDTSVTPLQLATYAGTLANYGTRYQTHIVKSILSYNLDEVVKETPITVLSQVEDDVAFNAVKEGMVGASLNGSAARFIGNYPKTIASKTGTPQVTVDKFNGTIIAYGPTEEPELAVGVVLENCGNGYMLAMTVRDMFDAYYQSMGQSMTPTQTGVLLQ